MKGIMHVQTAPASPEQLDAYHAWYENHIREIGEVDGVVRIRRYAPAGDAGGRFLTVYELEGDDIMEVAARVSAGARERTALPDGLVMTDPPATVQFFELITEHTPD
jgi:hypothetical protein